MVEEYIIEADNEAEARDIWANTNCPSPVAVEHQEEKIDNIERIKDEDVDKMTQERNFY